MWPIISLFCYKTKNIELLTNLEVEKVESTSVTVHEVN